MNWDGNERRGNKRYGVKSSSVTYSRGGLFGFLRNFSDRYLLLNISISGLHFITKEDLEVGKTYKFLLEFPSIGYPVPARGKIIWTRKSTEHDAYRTGVLINHLSNKHQRVLRHILDNTLLDNVKISTGTFLKEIKRL
ncbi:MAG: PilZ domain-containing protein [Planctomycetota bacterium]|jgi:hypothetical protein|nr:PilZ domain-containing protein [Planctomycetota bacterium]